ncbi:MAG: DUF599 domain-containing protein [Aquabacterium sp.]
MPNSLSHLFELLPWQDWAALALFVFGWVGYALFAGHRAKVESTLLASTNHYRRLWMAHVTYRDQRIVDAAVAQNLSTSPNFWASTTILVLGGLLAVLGTNEKATDIFKDLPFAARTSMLIFDVKIVVLLAVFVYAFFRFTWSMHATPSARSWSAPRPMSSCVRQRRPIARTSPRARGQARCAWPPRSFADGLRANLHGLRRDRLVHSPAAFAIGTLAVLWILYRREFRSDVLAVLRA